MTEVSWANANDLPQLGELTARWLLGELDYHPSYAGDPDTETGPLAAALAAINRAGFVTDFSQPGYPDVDGSAQRAAVAGFCSEKLAQQLATMLGPTDLVVLADYPGSGSAVQIPVTLDEGAAYTWVGGDMPIDYIEQCYEGVHPDGVRSLVTSMYVTVFDPVWGRNDQLWPTLLAALDGGSATPTAPQD